MLQQQEMYVQITRCVEQSLSGRSSEDTSFSTEMLEIFSNLDKEEHVALRLTMCLSP